MLPQQSCTCTDQSSFIWHGTRPRTSMYTRRDHFRSMRWRVRQITEAFWSTGGNGRCTMRLRLCVMVRKTVTEGGCGKLLLKQLITPQHDANPCFWVRIHHFEHQSMAIFHHAFFSFASDRVVDCANRTVVCSRTCTADDHTETTMFIDVCSGRIICTVVAAVLRICFS